METEAKSLAERFSELPKEEQIAKISSLSENAKKLFKYDWKFWARPKQLLPPGDWTFWLVRAGRGFGKTRVGAETVRQWVRDFPIVNLIGPTADAVKHVMIEGESGILAVCPPNERPDYVGNELRWPNGAKSLLYSAEKPERLRGPQHMKLWVDELASWRYAEAWTQAKFGLRLGRNPQVVITTTPRPTKIIVEIAKDAATVETVGSSYENRANIAKQYYDIVIQPYEGTRLGRQEINAEILVDRPDALWKRENIDAHRVTPAELPELQRIVVPVDPAVTSKATSDETGIVPVGRDHRSPAHFYVLDDVSGIMTPNGWGVAAVAAYKNLDADRIVGESNQGGDLVESNIRNVDANVSYKSVHASRGKARRAEPIAALYEQGRVHHVGFFAKLEDQMCDFDPKESNPNPSPDRMDALVWGLTELAEKAGGGEPFVEVLGGVRRSDDWGWQRVG